MSVIIAARNEAADIGRRLENLVALDYPRDRLEVVIASDGSEDGTAAIVAGWSDRGVRLLDLPRVGKADALNAAVAASSGEILVFSDANSMFAPDAVRALVRRFADPEVGGVAGDQRYETAATGDGLAEGERGYWDLDRLLKIAESRAGNVVSATGAIYAIRRTLFRPVATGVTDDFYTSVAVVAQGRRLVFARDAVAFEPPAKSGGDEFGRKVRIMTRGLRGTILMRELLDPRRHGFYAIQLAWHKIFRRLMVVPLLGLFASSLLLVGRGRIYTLAALAQLAGYGLGLAGLALRDQPVGRKKLALVPGLLLHGQPGRPPGVAQHRHRPADRPLGAAARRTAGHGGRDGRRDRNANRLADLRRRLPQRARPMSEGVAPFGELVPAGQARSRTELSWPQAARSLGGRDGHRRRRHRRRPRGRRGEQSAGGGRRRSGRPCSA